MTCRTHIRLIALLVTLPACGSPEQATAQSDDVALSPRVNHPEHVVARVNGVPILREDVERQGGGDARQALDAVVARELLAQEAVRRGLKRHPDVQRAHRRALANLLVRRHFAPRFTKADIPKELLEQAYELNKLHFWRPELRKITHILIRATNRNTAEFHKRTVKLALEVRGVATSGPLTEEEFKQIPDLFREKHKTVSFKVETGTVRPDYGTAESFRKAAFKIKKVGDIAPVVQTKHGYHILYLVEIIEPRKVTLEQADAELRERVFKQAKSQAFERWAEDLERRYNAQLTPKGSTGR